MAKKMKKKEEELYKGLKLTQKEMRKEKEASAARMERLLRVDCRLREGLFSRL